MQVPSKMPPMPMGFSSSFPFIYKNKKTSPAQHLCWIIKNHKTPVPFLTSSNGIVFSVCAAQTGGGVHPGLPCELSKFQRVYPELRLELAPALPEVEEPAQVAVC